MIDLIFERLESSHKRPYFECGDDDLNDFFHNDSIHSDIALMSVTYIAKCNDDVVAFFSVSNDSIIKNLLSNGERRRLFKEVPHQKQYSSTPAVKIGRLATASTWCKKGIGTQILDAIKYSFTHGNKTGCRFITIDAYNEEKPIKFYLKNGFKFLSATDEGEDTRSMYFDLITFKDGL